MYSHILPDHTWILTNAAIANDVYNDDKSPETPISGFVRIKSSPKDSPTGYFGAAYSHDRAGQIIIAHRGTSNIRDIIEDLEILEDRPFSQLDEAIAFADAVVKEFPKEKVIFQTGHSLGAVLAELLGTLHGGSQYGSITFENPGSMDIMRKWMSSKNLRMFVPSGATGTIIQSRFNMINTCHRQIGSTYIALTKPYHMENVPEAMLRFPYEIPSRWSGNPYYMLTNTLEQHPMQPLLDYLDDRGRLGFVQAFPIGFQEGYRAFLESDFWNSFMIAAWDKSQKDILGVHEKDFETMYLKLNEALCKALAQQ